MGASLLALAKSIYYFHRVFFSRYVEPVEEVQGKTQTQCSNLGITFEDGILFKYRALLYGLSLSLFS